MSRFIIKALQSDSTELPKQLPATGYTVNVLTDSRGASTYRAVLDTPLRLSVDAEFDRRLAPDRLGRDAQGPFLWVSEVLLSPHRADQQPYPGMRDFEMEMAAILNPPDFDGAVTPPDLAPMGLAFIDDADESTPPLHRGDGDGSSTHVGQPVTEIPEPKCVSTGKERRQGMPAYSVTPTGCRYFTKDPWNGQYVMHETTDPDELLFWIAYDLTRIAAWSWTLRTPAFPTVTGPQAKRTLFMPMWHALMYALSEDWGARARQVADDRRR